MREPTRNPSEALRRYKHVLQRALGLVTAAQWVTGLQDRQQDRHFLITNPDAIRLATDGDVPVYLRAAQSFTYENDRRWRGEWKVKTLGYAYTVGLGPNDGDQLVAWHWHPDVLEACHLHVYHEDQDLGPLRKLHMPTARVSFEQIIRFTINDLGVRARVGWEDVLAECEARFSMFRTWH